MKVRQAVIPAAGLGSRFLPVTKNVPKELLPLLDKPCLQYVIDEAIDAGVEEFIIVISPEKTVIQSYFTKNDRLDQWLLKRGQRDIYLLIKEIENRARYKFVMQEEPLGLGHAVLCAESLITDNHFFVILPDDIISADIPVCRQMIDVFLFNQRPTVAVMEVPWEEVRRYGIVQADPISENLGDIKNIVEKPTRENAPSKLAVIGRYLLPKEIFSYLKKTKPGAGNEIQLTDALKDIIPKTGLNSYLFAGERFDTGTPVGLMLASMGLSLKNPAFRDAVKDQIKMLAATT